MKENMQVGIPSFANLYHHPLSWKTFPCKNYI